MHRKVGATSMYLSASGEPIALHSTSTYSCSGLSSARCASTQFSAHALMSRSCLTYLTLCSSVFVFQNITVESERSGCVCAQTSVSPKKPHR